MFHSSKMIACGIRNSECLTVTGYVVQKGKILHEESFVTVHR